MRANGGHSFARATASGPLLQRLPQRAPRRRALARGVGHDHDAHAGAGESARRGRASGARVPESEVRRVQDGVPERFREILKSVASEVPVAHVMRM